jgi:hypothetical protein
MLGSVPSADHEHFYELGDGYVYTYTPLHAMKKYLYPTLRVMQKLHSLKGEYEYLPGGVESMIVYSYFHQGGGVPRIEPNGTSGFSGTPFSLREATSLTNFVSTLK